MYKYAFEWYYWYSLLSSRDWKMTHTINYDSYKTCSINRFFLTFGYCAKKLSTFKYRNCIKIHSLLNIATKGISLPFHNCKFFVSLNILSNLSDNTSCDIYTLYDIHRFSNVCDFYHWPFLVVIISVCAWGFVLGWKALSTNYFITARPSSPHPVPQCLLLKTKK